MLYRLDYLNEDGSTGEAVPDPILGGDFLCRHMTTARSHAMPLAKVNGRAILVTRIGKAGQMRPSLVIQPDGTATRPGGMAGEDCKAGKGQGACFCRNCRASRRAS